MTRHEPSDGIGLHWNPDGWADGADGQPEQGRWEYWVDDDLALWWSDSDRQLFHQQHEDGQP